MYDNFNSTMTEYRDADFNHRLNMYLQYPWLRSDFIRIDQNELETIPSTSCRLPKKMPAARISLALGLVATYAKKILGLASA